MPDQAAGSRDRPEADASGDATVRTVLIADIRGYTSYTGERGDEAAAILAQRFAEVTREVVSARGGQLVELRGDEALVVFSSARQALRAALDLQARIAAAQLPRGVGIGLDAGEAVAVADGYRGSALNLAARLCSLAGPGEVLASDAVVHLASTVEGIRYVAPRAVRVKGFPQPIRAVRVVPASAAPEAHRLIPVSHRLSGRRLALMAAGLVGAAGATAGLFALGMARPDETASSPSPDATASLAAAPPPYDGPGLAFLDPETGEPAAERLPMRNAVEVEYVDGAFWALDLDPRALHRVDPRTHEVTGSIPIGFDQGNFLVDGPTVWFTDYEEPLIHKLDVATGRQITEIRVTDELTGLQGIAIGDGSLWVALRDMTDGLARVDPTTGEVLHRYPVFAAHVVANDEAVWAAGFNSGEIHRIDPRTDEVTHTVPVTPPIANLLLAEGYLWATNPSRGELFKIDAQGRITDTFSAPGAWYVASAGGRVWAAGEEERRIERIDILTGEQVTFEVGRAVNDLAEGEGQLAIVMPKQVADMLAGISDDLLRVGTSVGPFEYTDPAVAGQVGNAIRDQVEQATCAKLLNYPDEPPPAGWELYPEIAARMPDVSADGLTYAYTVRDGYAFSPPSGEPLTAETFRFSIERALSPELGPNATAIEELDMISGARAYHDGEANSVSGLAVDGNVLTITLERPDPMFLHRLALPLVCPVPLGTPALLNGVSHPPIPRSGPYYISDDLGGTAILLERNPNYPGPRRAAFDAIIWRVLEDSGRLIAQVERGELDLVVAAEGLEPGGPVADAWGPDSDPAAGGDQRWFMPPGQEMDALALNPNDALLGDPDVRGAIALVLDRAELAEAFAGLVAVSLVSPALPASELTTPAGKPDAVRARELLDGRTGSVNVAVCPFPPCQAWGEALARQLEQIDIAVELVTVESAQEAGDPALEIGLANAFGGAGSMLPDSAAALNRLLEDVPPGWIPADVMREAVELLTRSEPDRSRATAALAERLVNDGLLLPFATYGIAGYVSERIGCELATGSSPGLDLVTLCLEDGS